ncbi:MAG TPA: hypothetical protein PLA65_14820 [Spirochaetota bacterium]|nr:hypothetical protein [Spirochaetota bacterium]HPN13330.1 hypothetical protein [Spirochaetota bacterium]
MKLNPYNAAIEAMIVSLVAMLIAVPGRVDASRHKLSINTAHFIISYQPGTEDLGMMTAGLSEDAYVRISNFLDHDLTHSIAITVWPARTGPDPTGESLPSRACRHSPVSRHINVTFPGSVQGLRRSLLHKIAHAFIHDMFADEHVPIPGVRYMPMPDWFSESMALYCAGFPGGDDVRPLFEVTAESVPGLYSIAGFPAFPGGVADHRLIGFIRFLDDIYGSNYIGEIIRDIRDTGSFDDSLRIATGKSLQELESDFSAYIAHRTKGDALPGAMEYANGILPVYNISPSVSPDGTLIAYLSATSQGALLQLASTAVKTSGHAGDDHPSPVRELNINRASLYPVDNRISWTGDGTTMMMAGCINNAEAIVFIDSISGRIVSNEILPFRAVMFPALSGNGRYIIFTGSVSSSSDLYMYDRHNASITRITEDAFFERDPIIARDGNNIIYSTNSNESGDIMRGSFDIVKRDIKTGAISVLVKNGFVNIQPALSPDMKRLLYVSNEGGIFNIFLLDLLTLKTVKLTNYASGSSYPAWLPSGDGMAYVVNVLQGSEVRVEALNTGTSVK